MFAGHQVVSALALGADYIAPYLGRMNDAGMDVSEGGWIQVPLPLMWTPCASAAAAPAH